MKDLPTFNNSIFGPESSPERGNPRISVSAPNGSDAGCFGKNRKPLAPSIRQYKPGWAWTICPAPFTRWKALACGSNDLKPATVRVSSAKGSAGAERSTVTDGIRMHRTRVRPVGSSTTRTRFAVTETRVPRRRTSPEWRGKSAIGTTGCATQRSGAIASNCRSFQLGAHKAPETSTRMNRRPAPSSQHTKPSS